jgi:alkanesulfonate monooxygenase SsuD/methylene tetrahydromethanopterin reductase-like flavin-dependent oxidoreductase (luciferase family)
VRLARAVGFQQLATLDVITGGRLIVGVGPGYRAVENHTLQVDPRTRVSRFEEALGVVERVRGASRSPTRARESVIPHVR